jgi:NAD-reducing hydrogenase large subunit
VTPEGGLEHYDGLLRVVDSDGNVLEPGLAPSRYREIFGEAVEPWSYLKFPYYKPAAVRKPMAAAASLDHYQAGMYRVGPLARVNVCDFAGTPRADAELREFRRLAPRGRRSPTASTITMRG